MQIWLKRLWSPAAFHSLFVLKKLCSQPEKKTLIPIWSSECVSSYVENMLGIYLLYFYWGWAAMLSSFYNTFYLT